MSIERFEVTPRIKQAIHKYQQSQAIMKGGNTSGKETVKNK